MNESPIEALMNLYEGALIVHVFDLPDHGAPSRVTARVDSSWFEANERGLTFLGSVAWASVTNCTFVRNAAMHAGAGLLIYTYASNPAVNVTGCRFVGNAAGFVNTETLAAYADSFRIHDDEVSSAV